MLWILQGNPHIHTFPLTNVSNAQDASSAALLLQIYLDKPHGSWTATLSCGSVTLYERIFSFHMQWKWHFHRTLSKNRSLGESDQDQRWGILTWNNRARICGIHYDFSFIHLLTSYNDDIVTFFRWCLNIFATAAKGNVSPVYISLKMVSFDRAFWDIWR